MGDDLSVGERFVVGQRRQYGDRHRDSGSRDVVREEGAEGEGRRYLDGCGAGRGARGSAGVDVGEVRPARDDLDRPGVVLHGERDDGLAGRVGGATRSDDAGVADRGICGARGVADGVDGHVRAGDGGAGTDADLDGTGGARSVERGAPRPARHERCRCNAHGEPPRARGRITSASERHAPSSDLLNAA